MSISVSPKVYRYLQSVNDLVDRFDSFARSKGINDSSVMDLQAESDMLIEAGARIPESSHAIISAISAVTSIQNLLKNRTITALPRDHEAHSDLMLAASSVGSADARVLSEEEALAERDRQAAVDGPLGTMLVLASNPDSVRNAEESSQ